MVQKQKKHQVLSISSITALLSLVIGICIGFGFHIILFPSNPDAASDTTATYANVLQQFQSQRQEYIQDIGSHSALIDPVAPKSRRLLFMAAVYGMKQFLYLQRTLDYVRDICNAGWNVSVVLHMSNEIQYDHPRYREIQDRAYCHASGAFIPIELQHYGKIGFGLNKQHRITTLQRLDEYDYFVYAEEDMAFSLNHLNAFIAGETKLKKAFPKTWVRYIVGFLRWGLAA